MAGKKPRWIHVCKWQDFQHYRDRDPLWLKTYLRLLRQDEYMNLTGHRRAILHGLWLLYAIKRRELAENSATLSRELGLKVTSRDLEALRHAGFIKISASKPLADGYQVASPEKEKEKERPSTTVTPGPAEANGAGDHDDLPSVAELDEKQRAELAERMADIGKTIGP